MSLLADNIHFQCTECHFVHTYGYPCAQNTLRDSSVAKIKQVFKQSKLSKEQLQYMFLEEKSGRCRLGLLEFLAAQVRKAEKQAASAQFATQAESAMKQSNRTPAQQSSMTKANTPRGSSSAFATAALNSWLRTNPTALRVFGAQVPLQAPAAPPPSSSYMLMTKAVPSVSTPRPPSGAITSSARTPCPPTNIFEAEIRVRLLQIIFVSRQQ